MRMIRFCGFRLPRGFRFSHGSLIQRLAVTALAVLVLAFTGCKSNNSGPGSGSGMMPPDPTAIINGTRDKLTPFRFNLTTDPASPTYTSPFMLKVHVIDSADHPADGVTLTADVSMIGMQEVQHVTFSGTGDGDYEGQVNVDMAGTWDVDLTATRDGKTRQQKMNIEVGG